jgi:hypothetical protein
MSLYKCFQLIKKLSVAQDMIILLKTRWYIVSNLTKEIKQKGSSNTFFYVIIYLSLSCK